MRPRRRGPTIDGMRRLVLISTLAASCIAATPPLAEGRTLCVGTRAACAATIQSALAAADDGDVINVAAGRYRGPLTITKSVTLAGAGAAATTIDGGGPVVTVGE